MSENRDGDSEMIIEIGKYKIEVPGDINLDKFNTLLVNIEMLGYTTNIECNEEIREDSVVYDFYWDIFWNSISYFDVTMLLDKCRDYYVIRELDYTKYDNSDFGETVNLEVSQFGELIDLMNRKIMEGVV